MHLLTPFVVGLLYWSAYGRWWGVFGMTLTGAVIWVTHLVRFPVRVERPAQTARRIQAERELASVVLVLTTFACALGCWQ